ncbi:hypothetical protein ACFPRL_29880 [Pseudoclavibacter helvolus]
MSTRRGRMPRSRWSARVRSSRSRSPSTRRPRLPRRSPCLSRG